MKTKRTVGFVAFLMVSVALVGFTLADVSVAEVETIGSDCYGQEGIGVYETEEIEGGVRFKGVMETSNPCHTVNLSEVRKDGDTYIVDLVGEPEDVICIQCVGAVTYEVTLEAEGSGDVQVLHNGDDVSTIDLENIGSSKGSGMFTAFIDWLRSLF